MHAPKHGPASSNGNTHGNDKKDSKSITAGCSLRGGCLHAFLLFVPFTQRLFYRYNREAVPYLFWKRDRDVFALLFKTGSGLAKEVFRDIDDFNSGIYWLVDRSGIGNDALALIQ